MRRFTTAVTAGLLASVTVLAACGSSESDAGGGGGGTNTNAAEASEFYNEYTANPTSIGVEEPLPERPDPNRSVIFLLTPGPVSEVENQGLEAAAETLGWNYGFVDAGATPSSAASAFEAAIARNPDAIIFAGYPAAVFTEQIAQANEAGITVVSNATGDEPVEGVLADLGGIADEELFGKLTAAYFVANSSDDERAVIYTLSAFPILTRYTDAFQRHVAEWCPDCSLEVVDQQFGDVGTRTPSNVVSYLQRNPDVEWVISANGDLSQGVSAAVRAAGMQDVRILGQVPAQSNIVNVASGAETAWAGFPVDVLSWRVIDLLARHFAGLDVSEVAQIPLPLQLITRDNANDLVTDDSGYYVGVEGFDEQFRELWQVN